MSGINYENLELRALAHMAYQCGPRIKRRLQRAGDASGRLSRREGRCADAHRSFSRKLRGEAGPGYTIEMSCLFPFDSPATSVTVSLSSPPRDTKGPP